MCVFYEFQVYMLCTIKEKVKYKTADEAFLTAKSLNLVFVNLIKIYYRYDIYFTINRMNQIIIPVSELTHICPKCMT